MARIAVNTALSWAMLGAKVPAIQCPKWTIEKDNEFSSLALLQP